MNFKNILIIIVSLFIILYASFITNNRDIQVKNILNEHDTQINNENYDDIEEFNLYNKCSNNSLKRCYNSLDCGISIDNNNNMKCKEGRIYGPYEGGPVKTWVYNGLCWGNNCNNITSFLNNIPDNPFNRNSKINNYNN